MSGGLSSKGYHGQENGSKQKHKWFSWTTCRQEPHAKLKDFSVLLMEICISWLQGRLNEAACDDWISLGKSEPKGNKKLERKNPRRQISIYFITKCRQPGYISIEMAALHKKTIHVRMGPRASASFTVLEGKHLAVRSRSVHSCLFTLTGSEL